MVALQLAQGLVLDQIIIRGVTFSISTMNKQTIVAYKLYYTYITLLCLLNAQVQTSNLRPTPKIFSMAEMQNSNNYDSNVKANIY